MPDSKITALTNLTAADAINDMFPIVDVSDNLITASGTTKRISVNNLLSSSPTASGAFTVTGLVTAGSATITGAATVGTTLGVTGQSTLTGSVGIGAAPVSGTRLNVRTATSTDKAFTSDNGLNADFVVQYASGLTTIGAELNVPLAFKTNNIERMRLTGGNLSLANGNVVMTTSGTGIDFSATADSSGTMTSELLADYEEGTFTPVVQGSTTAGVGVYSTQTGRYTKIGRLVTVEIYIGWTAHTGTGNLRIGGLPFTVNAAAYSAATIGLISNIALSASNTASAFNEINTTYINIVQSPVGGGAFTDVPMDVAGTFVISSTYSV